jgi:hypothetical protein
VGRYNPASGAKFLMLTGSTVTGSLSCAITSGAGSGTRHWQATYTGTRLYLTRRNGRYSC